MLCSADYGISHQTVIFEVLKEKASSNERNSIYQFTKQGDH